jgi:hypothetical protein
MAGARKWRVDFMSRKDLASLTEEAAKVTGIPYIMDAKKPSRYRNGQEAQSKSSTGFQTDNIPHNIQKIC